MPERFKTSMIDHDPWLEPYRDQIEARRDHVEAIRNCLPLQDLYGAASHGHETFGFNFGTLDRQPGIWYREWAPGASALFLCGDFNGWNRKSHPLSCDEWGVWSIFLPDVDSEHAIAHASTVKVHVVSGTGAHDRIPAYIRRVIQLPGSAEFVAQYWAPNEDFTWKYESPKLQGGLRIYEAHVGMAPEEGKVGTYLEFTEKILPRIADLGYNAIQLMAIMEHPYYGSFGYQVSSFFAPSSRFGTPEELKLLIDQAHGLGLKVIMDLIHSHAVKNLNEGLAEFDGTEYQYFHAGPRGHHPAWDSKCFDYGKPEVLRFLLSNVRYWLEEFRFDGFRFDGVTSMLYIDHGLGREFASYNDYFGANVDEDAVSYLTLANELAHQILPDVITIAEDVSGLPGMGRPGSEGGLGFDYRLAMGIPDLWIRLLKERRDEDWPLEDLYGAMLNRRTNEKHIGYAESHDQAMVGDKTIAFWLMDSKMYSNMSKFQPDPSVDRGIALHKMIRLLTFSLAGEGYLNFMGNEFGHPEWIDFPTPANNFSYHYARRQWSLVDSELLRYHELRDFDRSMMRLDQNQDLLEDHLIEQLAIHEDTRQLVYRHGPLVFAFNFHPTESYVGLRIPIPDRTDYELVLNTDSLTFGGHGLVEEPLVYPWQDVGMYGREQSLQIYLPARSAQVLRPVHPR